MANDYFTATGNPGTRSPGSSATMRTQFNDIEAAFDKLPDLTTNANKAVVVNAGSTALTVTAGTLALTGNVSVGAGGLTIGTGGFTTTGTGAITLTATGTTNVTLPTTGTLATVNGALGSATATTLAIGGATIGTHALAVTGTVDFNSAVTMDAALTYGGVTLTNAVTGTGSMVLSSGPSIASPTITGVLTGVGSNSATTFLGADVALGTAGGAFVNGPNTGSIGASGQVWLIIAVGNFNNTVNAALYEMAIFNGSVYIADSEDIVAGANGYSTTTIAAVVTLSAATTFTLRARALTENNTLLKTTGGASGIANKATSITAVRLS